MEIPVTLIREKVEGTVPRIRSNSIPLLEAWMGYRVIESRGWPGQFDVLFGNRS